RLAVVEQDVATTPDRPLHRAFQVRLGDDRPVPGLDGEGLARGDAGPTLVLPGRGPRRIRGGVGPVRDNLWRSRGCHRALALTLALTTWPGRAEADQAKAEEDTNHGGDHSECPHADPPAAPGPAPWPPESRGRG